MSHHEHTFKQLAHGVVEILPEGVLVSLLAEQRPLRIKAGFDPTAPNLHLGHTILFNKLRTFQDLGHDILLVIGDFTAMIGDPTGKNRTRPQLSRDQVLAHTNTYAEQAFKILDQKKTQLLFNSSWMDQFHINDLIKLASKQTVARMLEREDFSLRYKNNQPIAIHEFLYPLIQGYDSVVLKADFELGGTDQRFNLLMGREIQKHYCQASQAIMILPLLTGTDGIKKMSKSHGNTIDITETPEEMFGQLMSISDVLMWEYIELLSFQPIEEQKRWRKEVDAGANPRDVKVKLALEIVERFHNADSAKHAHQAFVARFKRHQLPKDLPIKDISIDTPNILLTQLLKRVGLVASTSEAIRLIRQGGVKINEEKITDPTLLMLRGCTHIIYQVGKRHIVNVEIAVERGHEEAAQQGDALAQTNLGFMYAKGRGVEQDYTKAVSWYRKAAQQGDALAQANLGLMYVQGQGVEQDDEEAVSWYRKAAEQGDALAQTNLGLMYAQGRGVEQDYTKAVSWYKEAAEQGDALAQTNLGFMYAKGRGVEQDDEEAVSWYRKAAEQGDALAQHNLGFSYEKGQGVEQDDKEAVSWYRKATEQGNALAQNGLGTMYAEGRGVEQDDKEAASWFEKAAKQGFALARINLDRLHRKVAEQGDAEV